MKPTRIHYFFAQDWPIKVWVFAVPSLCILAAIYAWVIDGVPLSALGTLLIFVLPLTFFGAILLMWLVLGPIYHARMLKNGGPFKVGDMVKILVGPHRDRVTRVYKRWQGDSVRVELGEQEKETLKDIFGPTQLIKESDGIDTQRT